MNAMILPTPPEPGPTSHRRPAIHSVFGETLNLEALATFTVSGGDLSIAQPECVSVGCSLEDLAAISVPLTFGKLKVVSVIFPAGAAVLEKKEAPSQQKLPVADPESEDKELLLPLITPTEPEPERLELAHLTTCTRIRPPRDVVKLEDRLYFLLQPPLEQIFASATLDFPFKPFKYQFDGVAFLYPRHQAVLADEMGLGKTMQTIVAMRLLAQQGHVRRVLLVAPSRSLQIGNGSSLYGPPNYQSR
jgi:hypothetical protein